MSFDFAVIGLLGGRLRRVQPEAVSPLVTPPVTPPVCPLVTSPQPCHVRLEDDLTLSVCRHLQSDIAAFDVVAFDRRMHCESFAASGLTA